MSDADAARFLAAFRDGGSAIAASRVTGFTWTEVNKWHRLDDGFRAEYDRLAARTIAAVQADRIRAADMADAAWRGTGRRRS